jgi:hypothetical protein
MFEADAEVFRGAGIRVGADPDSVERGLIESALEAFDVPTRNEAVRMGRLYALIYCFENAVRGLITERLQELHGVSWWETHVPKRVREFAEGRMKEAQDNSWLEGARKDPLGFVQFGHLADIIVENWDDFSDLIPSQHWLKQRMDEMEKARNFIAHNRLLLPGEFQRLEIYVGDWNRGVGL